MDDVCGYIKLWRSLIHWEWYNDILTTRLFVHLLVTACWRDTEQNGIALRRGQRLVTQVGLASETGLSRQEIRTCLQRLISTNELTIEQLQRSTRCGSVITLVKYHFYQEQTTTLPTKDLTAESPIFLLKKEVKEVKEYTPYNPPQGGEGGKKPNSQPEPGRGKAKPKKQKLDEAYELIDKSTGSKVVQDAAKGWVEMRFSKGAKHQPTALAMEKAFKLVREWYGKDEAKAAACFDQSTICNWDGVFRVKD
ncbi:MAG: hypothetical protein RR051_06945 [Clostridiales bacterium]